MVATALPRRAGALPEPRSNKAVGGAPAPLTVDSRPEPWFYGRGEWGGGGMLARR